MPPSSSPTTRASPITAITWGRWPAPERPRVGAYLRDFWAGCAAVIAPGSELADEIRAEIGPRQRPFVRVVPTGVDVAGIRAIAPIDPRPAHGWPAEATVVVSVGRLAEEKSVDLLLEAFALAAAGDPQLRLLLVGGGPSEASLRQRARVAAPAGHVAFTGSLPRNEALARARGCDLFAFASRTETQGLVLTEALAGGLPVVARAGPGVRDAVRDGVDGLVVGAAASDDPRPLAEAMGSLARDGARRAAMAGAATEAALRFDVGRRIGQVVDLYREVLTGRTTAG